ncbi:MAG TPA: AraC family transcriptional regulator [Chitinophaga sp.]|uniref:AraC family transcriptional regulator n=1 Tax=Chitinophaga sp. TaxID=1869181 RepID=UPI002BCBEE62|nr:AraC family transcriptional regulator [Chitinophaga sp.]HVI47229.1 AraC family transcriptional regulator [Chitinophaga sp.]
MLRKKDGFEGQRAIVLPKAILTKHCSSNPLIAGAYITDIGYYPKARYHYRERIHGSAQHILIYVLEGEGEVQIKKDKYQLQRGNFIIIPADTYHKYAADEQSPWTIYWVHFTGSTTHAFLELLLSQNNSYKGHVDFRESRIQLFENMYTSLEMGYSIDNLCQANMCLPYFLTSYVFHENYNRAAGHEKQIDAINISINYMRDHIDEMTTLQQIARAVNLSVSHFSFLFRKKTGFSPIEYLTHLKVQKACQYLLFTNLRIKEIAHKLGVEDQYYFSRMFTKVMGMSPAAYRSRKIS